MIYGMNFFERELKENWNLMTIFKNEKTETLIRTEYCTIIIN